MKTKTNRWGWIGLTVLAIALTACSTQASAPTAAAPIPTDSPVPAASPTAVPSPTVAPSATLAASPTAAGSPTAAVSATAQSFTDPFAYCAAVGTVDTPDARYTGAPVPDSIINGYKIAAGLPNTTEPLEMLQKTTIWRCMGGVVYVCNYGANLPCSSKANADKTPTQGMLDYCTANPDSDFIPAFVTGHDTIYSWRCVKTTPTVQDQISKVDAAGYLADIWYQLPPIETAAATATAQP